MKLYRVTLTGADNSICPEALLNLSEDYPFVEWGILLSQRQMGGPRFPSLPWITGLVDEVGRRQGEQINISLHLCGTYMRELLLGHCGVLREHSELFDIAQRVQLNFHAERQIVDMSALLPVLRFHKKQWIFQLDGVNDGLLTWAMDSGVNAVGLFDRSHGAGVLPERWPLPDFTAQCYGFAGGLGPDNIEQQIPSINAFGGCEIGSTHIGDRLAANTKADFWIDMEGKLRTVSSRHPIRGRSDRFSLAKCVQVLNKCMPFVQEEQFHAAD